MDATLWRQAVDAAADSEEIIQAFGRLMSVSFKRQTGNKQSLISYLIGRQAESAKLVVDEVNTLAEAEAALIKARNDHPFVPEPPPQELVDAYQQSQESIYRLGRESHKLELELQRIQMQRSLLTMEEIQRTVESQNLLAPKRPSPILHRWLRLRSTPSESQARRLDRQLAHVKAQRVKKSEEVDKANAIDAQIQSTIANWEINEDKRHLQHERFKAPIQSAHQSIAAARKKLERALLEKAALPAAREWLNRIVAQDKEHLYRFEFDTDDTSGLRQLAAADDQISMSAIDKLAKLMDRLGGGAIGISGPRGVGKSTIIRVAARASRTRQGLSVRGVVVQAPVEYAPQEFISHLFAKLCRQFVPSISVPEEVAEDEPTFVKRAILTIASSTVLVGCVLIVHGLTSARATSNPQSSLQLVAIVAAFATAFIPYQKIIRQLGYASFKDAVSIAIRSETTKPGVGHSASGVAASEDAERDQIDRTQVRRSSERSLAEIEQIARRVALDSTVLSRYSRSLAAFTSGAAAAAIIAQPVIAQRSKISSLHFDPSMVYAGLIGSLMLATSIALVVGAREQMKRLVFLYAVSGVAATVSDSILSSTPIVEARLLACVLAFVAGGCFAIAQIPVENRSKPTDPKDLTYFSIRTFGLIGGSIAFVLSAGAYAASSWQIPVSQSAMWGSLIAASSLHLIFAISVFTQLDVSRTITYEHLQPQSRQDAIYQRSKVELELLEYQETRKHGWSRVLKLSPSAKLPIELSLSAERSVSGERSIARVARTYPETIYAFQDYLTFLARDHRIIIGIDELDKLSSDAADRFVNEVKVLFDGITPNCFFLVSVSEEALASFEQRGILARDVFDSAFDDILNVPLLSLTGTITMLEARYRLASTRCCVMPPSFRWPR